MKKVQCSTLVVTWLLSLVLPLPAQQRQKRLPFDQGRFEPQGTAMAVNKITHWIYANGKSGITPDDNAGIYYPSGTAGVVFEDGIVWGGKVIDGQTPFIRVDGQTFSVGTRPGGILSPGVAEDFNDPAVNRIWKIRRDFGDARALQEEISFIEHKPFQEVTQNEVNQLREQYRKDWLEWPTVKGAPFYDADSDGVYTPRFTTDGNGLDVPVLFPQADEPGLANADQVVWLVANDLDDSTTTSLYGSPPIGVEMQTTLWGYRSDPTLANVLFKRVRLIYKGTARTTANAFIDNMYFAQFSDPDLGEFTDDFVGSDVPLNLGYAYNAFPQDRAFKKYDLAPPAFGYDILAGPIVSGDNNEEGIFDLKKRPRSKNRPMTHFSFSAAGDPSNDPTYGGDYNGTLQWWNILRGFLARPESPSVRWFNPLTEQSTLFVLDGDPVTGEGWIDTNGGDRRFFMTSGPFNLQRGESNEIYIALVGGLGSDRLNSITAMKFNDRVAQQSFDDLFAGLKPPPPPKVTATELDGEIILNWGVNQEEIERVENFTDGTFSFEGYNIYQIPDVRDITNKETKIATFDLANDVGTVVQEQFDPESGSVISVPVQLADNSGIQYSMTVDRDEINKRPLLNGQTYHFTVTSYSVNRDLSDVIKFMESTPVVVSVTPHALNPGEDLHAVLGDTIPVHHSQGQGQGRIVVKVKDAKQLTGDDYQIGFSDTTVQNMYGYWKSTAAWHLVNSTTGDTLLKDQIKFFPDSSVIVTDGFQVLVEDVPPDFQRTANGEPAFIEVANENGPLTKEDFDAQGAPFGGNLVWHSVNSSSSADRYFLSTTTSGETALRTNFENLVPNDYELRFTTLADGSYGWWAFSTEHTAKVPFQIWQVGVGTFDDPSDDVQLIPIMFEGGGTADAYTPDHGPEGFSGVPAFDRIYWYQVAKGFTYDDYAQDAADGSVTQDYTSVEIIGRLLVADFDGDGQPPRPGTVVRIFSTRPNSPDDVFTFSTADFAPTFSLQGARQDVQQINVFPNPYYGLFRFESPFPDQKYVTFSHLPQKAIVRIFSLSGTMVRKLEKDDPGQFLRWDLLNDAGRAVAGGLYLAHVEMQELGVTKVLKLAVFHE